MISFFSNENLSDSAPPEVCSWNGNSLLMLNLLANNSLYSQVRAKTINKVDPELKEHFTKLNSELNSTSAEDFLAELESCSSKVDLMIKKVDSKKEKVILSENQQSLIVQMSECQDPILSLHMSVLLLFQLTHNRMLHASGKFVPQLLSFLQKDLDGKLYAILKSSQDLVLQSVSSKEEELKQELLSQMSTLCADYKQLINEFISKKRGSSGKE